MKLLLLVGSLLSAFATQVAPGTIRGTVHYPGCVPPDDLTVCAEPADRGPKRCTRPIVTETEITYELVVPPGRWLVYSTAESMMPGRRAYYGRAVLCGLTVDCLDHTPIPVEVESGKTVRGVDPDDWWADRDSDVPSV